MEKFDKGKISDGFHTFDELYEHRTLLMAALMRFSGQPAWRSRQHDDGSMFEDMFIVGMTLPVGFDGVQITYHVEAKHWETFAFAETLDKAPHYDGHTPDDVLKRLRDWLLLGVPQHRANPLCTVCGGPVSMIDREEGNTMHPRCRERKAVRS